MIARPLCAIGKLCNNSEEPNPNGRGSFFMPGGRMTAGARWKNGSARRAVLQYVRNRAASGEPCGICGRPIDVSLPQWYVDPKDGRRKRAPWSCECDEICPVSRYWEGGYASPEACALDRNNVQPVHRICNQRAGAKVRAVPRRIARAVDDETSRDWFDVGSSPTFQQ